MTKGAAHGLGGLSSFSPYCSLPKMRPSETLSVGEAAGHAVIPFLKVSKDGYLWICTCHSGPAWGNGTAVLHLLTCLFIVLSMFVGVRLRDRQFPGVKECTV